METNRFHSLDGLRGYSMLLGIAQHASLSFMPMLGAFGWVGWPINDISPSMFITGACFTTRMFRMINFFMIAGFSAHLLFHREGVANFFKVRAWRIVVPLVVGWIVLMPMFHLLMQYAFFKLNRPPTSFPPYPGTLLPVSLAHLWFLWVLLLCYVVMAGGRALLLRLLPAERGYMKGVDGVVRWLALNPLGVLVLAAPMGLVLYSFRYWLVWSGVPVPDRSLIPNYPAFTVYFLAFSFGWLLHRQQELLARLGKNWLAYFAVGAVCAAICMHLGGYSPDVSDPPQGWVRVVCASTYPVAAWCFNFALFGLAERYLSRPSQLSRYLSDASYWGYLVHLPLVLHLQIVMAEWNQHWSIKFSIIMLITVPLTLLTYNYLVRPSLIGKVLNGHRYPPGLSRSFPARRPAAALTD